MQVARRDTVYHKKYIQNERAVAPETPSNTQCQKHSIFIAAVVSALFTPGEAIELGAVSSPVGIDSTKYKLSCFFQMLADASAAAAAFFLTLAEPSRKLTHPSYAVYKFTDGARYVLPEKIVCGITFGGVIVGRRAKFFRVKANSLNLYSNEDKTIPFKTSL